MAIVVNTQPDTGEIKVIRKEQDKVNTKDYLRQPHDVATTHHTSANNLPVRIYRTF